MAKGVHFDEVSDVLGRPADMTEKQCSDLPVLRTHTADPEQFPVVISCWQFTPEELAEIARTGRVYITVLGRTMPPFCVDGIKDNVFYKG